MNSASEKITVPRSVWDLLHPKEPCTHEPPGGYRAEGAYRYCPHCGRRLPGDGVFEELRKIAAPEKEQAR